MTRKNNYCILFFFKYPIGYSFFYRRYFLNTICLYLVLGTGPTITFPTITPIDNR